MLTPQNYYVCITTNAFEITNLATGETKFSTSDQPFTTNRLLIGEFAVAERTLGLLLMQAVKASSSILPLAPIVIIHPLEMNEGSLSDVEKRVFTELALGAGARLAIVYNGPRLTKEQALSLLKESPKNSEVRSAKCEESLARKYQAGSPLYLYLFS